MRSKVKSYHQEKILPHNADDIMEMVYDVERYPDFLPWCQKARIIEKNGNQWKVELVVGEAMLRIPFISHVTIDKDQKKITMTNIKTAGPITLMESDWQFEPIGDQKTKVIFNIQFALNSSLLSTVMNPIFDFACRSMIESFSKRAATLCKKNKHDDADGAYSSFSSKASL